VYHVQILNEKNDRSSFRASARRPGATQARARDQKQLVCGIFERGGRVFTEIVPDVKAKTFQDVIRGKSSLESVVMTDGWKAYDGLVDVG
jgi:transposase